MRAYVCGIVENTASEAVCDLVGKCVLIDPRIRCRRSPVGRSKIGCPGSWSKDGLADFTATDYRQVHAVDSDFLDTEPVTIPTSRERHSASLTGLPSAAATPFRLRVHQFVRARRWRSWRSCAVRVSLRCAVSNGPDLLRREAQMMSFHSDRADLETNCRFAVCWRHGCRRCGRRRESRRNCRCPRAAVMLHRVRCSMRSPCQS